MWVLIEAVVHWAIIHWKQIKPRRGTKFISHSSLPRNELEVLREPNPKRVHAYAPLHHPKNATDWYCRALNRYQHHFEAYLACPMRSIP